MISFKQFFLQEFVKPTENSHFRGTSALMRAGAPRTDRKTGEVKNTGVNTVPDYMKSTSPNYKEEISAGPITPQQASEYSVKYDINLNELGNVPVQLGNTKSKAGKAVKLQRIGNQYSIIHV